MTALTIEERLIVLIEECAEVTHAATKCLRFGYDYYEPNYGVNKAKLASEIGDLLAMINSLPLDRRLIELSRIDKIARVEKAKREREGV